MAPQQLQLRGSVLFQKLNLGTAQSSNIPVIATSTILISDLCASVSDDSVGPHKFHLIILDHWHRLPRAGAHTTSLHIPGHISSSIPNGLLMLPCHGTFNVTHCMKPPIHLHNLPHLLIQVCKLLFGPLHNS